MKVEIEITQVTCATEDCGLIIFMTAALQARKRKDHSTFYCLNGHTQWYAGVTDDEKLRQKDVEISKLKEQLTEAQKPKKRGRPRKS